MGNLNQSKAPITIRTEIEPPQFDPTSGEPLPRRTWHYLEREGVTLAAVREFKGSSEFLRMACEQWNKAFKDKESA